MIETLVVLKRFEKPDEMRVFEKGRFEIVRIGGMTIGRATYEPGWKWSKHIGPTTGETHCHVEHLGLVVSGHATAAMKDGTVYDLTAGSLFYIPGEPHDSWVVGDKPYVSIHFLGAEKYSKQNKVAVDGNYMTDPKVSVSSVYPKAMLAEVYHLGYNSPLSYGGNSWLVIDGQGNWMIDSPRFVPQLIEKIKELGGLKYIFLTHRDDVAEADRYAKEFKARRIIHKHDKDAQPDAEIIIEGNKPQQFGADFLIIPVPGHTRGHMVLLWKDRALFTGDHLALDRKLRRPYAFRNYCWHSWEKQTESMKRLLDYSFEWIFAGHGQSGQLPREEMHAKLSQLIEEMEVA